MKNEKEQKTPDKASAYYRLHSEAVNDLVGATVENTPQYSKEELEKYTSGRQKKLRLPATLKIVLIKAWFYGAVCFFVFWGMGLYVTAQLDLYLIAALIMGMITDLLINSLLRFGEKRGGESRRYMMVTRTGVAGFALNMLYGVVLMFADVTVYTAVNVVLRMLFGSGEGAPFLGVEPILFGLITTGVDTLLISCKQTLMRIVADAMRRG